MAKKQAVTKWVITERSGARSVDVDAVLRSKIGREKLDDLDKLREKILGEHRKLPAA